MGHQQLPYQNPSFLKIFKSSNYCPNYQITPLPINQLHQIYYLCLKWVPIYKFKQIKYDLINLKLYLFLNKFVILFLTNSHKHIILLIQQLLLVLAIILNIHLLILALISLILSVQYRMVHVLQKLFLYCLIVQSIVAEKD